jgi:hypothetical protein
VKSDEEATTDWTKYLQPIPNLADKKVLREVKFNVRSQRDCGAAIAVGAGTVAISLLIGGGNVAVDAFYVLLTVQALLFYVARRVTQRLEELVSRAASRAASHLISVAPFIVLGVGYYLTSQLKQHGSNTGSRSWWWLLGLAGATGLLGLIIRRTAESYLDQLDDESWKQRLAPLVNGQERAIAEMWSMVVLLTGSNSLTSTPSIPRQRATSAQEPSSDLTSIPKTPVGPREARRAESEQVRRIRPGGMFRYKPSTEAEQMYQADVALAESRVVLLDAAREAESQLRQAQARRAHEAEIRRLAEDLDKALTAAMRAAYAAERAEIGPRGYEDGIYERKAKATPRVRALTAQAERLLTLRESHRLNGIPAVTFESSPPA